VNGPPEHPDKENAMNRRTFLRAAAALPAVAAASQVTGLALPARAQQKEFTPRPALGERSRSRPIEVLEPTGVIRAWLPVPSVKSDYQNRWATGGRGTRR